MRPEALSESPSEAGQERCRRCGGALTEAQEWCLQCGAARTLLRSPPDWRAPLALLVLVIVLAVVLLVVTLMSVKA